MRQGLDRLGTADKFSPGKGVFDRFRGEDRGMTQGEKN